MHFVSKNILYHKFLICQFYTGSTSISDIFLIDTINNNINFAIIAYVFNLAHPCLLFFTAVYGYLQL